MDTVFVNKGNRFIHVESGKYPVSLDEIRQTTGASFGESINLEIIREWGWDVVVSTPEPDGDVVSEGKPVFQVDRWMQQWVVTPFTDEQLAHRLTVVKAQCLEQLDLLYYNTVSVGFEWTIGEKTFFIQIRDVDLAPLTTIHQRGVQDPTAIISVRTASNEIVDVTGAEAVDMTTYGFQFGQEVLNSYWAAKDAILAASDLASIPDQLDSLL